MDNKKQTENVDTSFDNTDKKKEKPAKVKRIIKRILQLIIPFLFYPFLILFALIISPIFSSSDLGGIGVAIALIFSIFFPVYSFTYGLFVARSGKRNYLFAIYNAFLSTMHFFISSSFDLNSIGFYICIFFTILFWTSLPIVIHNYTISKLNEKPISSNESNSQSNVSLNGEKDYSKRRIDNKSYSLQMKKSIWRTIRLSIPVIFFLLWFSLTEAVDNIIIAKYGFPTIIEELIIPFGVLAISCLAYGSNVAKYEERKYLFALYYPVVSIYSLIQVRLQDMKNEYVLPFVVIFFFFTLLPIWISNHKNKSKAIKEASSVTEESPSISEEDKTDSEQ